MTENNQQNGTYIGIAAIIGGICLSAVVLVGVFSPDQMAVVPWIVGALSLMGIALGHFASNGA